MKNINRKQFLKNIFATAAFLALPTSFLLAEKNDKIKQKKQLHFVGLGGAGCNAIEFIQQRIPEAKFTCITTPDRPKLADSIHFINSGELSWDALEVMKIFRQNENPKTEIKVLNKFFEADETYIILIGLGGGDGTILSRFLFEKLKNENKEFYLVATTPFNFEGNKRIQLSDWALRYFENDKRTVIISNEYIREQYGNMTIENAFRKADELMMDKALELVKKNNFESILN